MSFATELLALVGTAADAYDIRASVRRCFFYDFDGYPLRLWDGQGVLTTSTGVCGAIIRDDEVQLTASQWIGTFDEAGNNLHQAPAVGDSRDGASPRYEFKIPYMDKATFDAMKADRDIARGRELTCYHALIGPDEGLLPLTPIRFAYRLVIQGTQFAEQMTGDPGNALMVRSASVVCRSLEYGRSRIPNSTYTDTAQRERARLLGITSDSGCAFVAANSRRTFRVGG